jgi:hypothetical protein
MAVKPSQTKQFADELSALLRRDYVRCGLTLLHLVADRSFLSILDSP